MFSRRALSSIVVVSMLAGCSKDDVAPSQSSATSVQSPAAPPSSVAATTSAAPPDASSQSGPQRSLIGTSQTLSLGIVLQKAVTEPQKTKMADLLKKKFPELKIGAEGGKLAPGSMGLGFTSAKESPVARLTKNVHGLDSAAVEKLADAETLVWLKWELEGDGAVARVKRVDEAIDAIAKENKGVVLDMTTIELYSPEAWHAERVATWDGDDPSVKRHFKIDYRPTGERHRAITRGLGAFALPDLVIADMPIPDAKRGAAFINVVAQLLVEGMTTGPNRELEVDVSRIRYAKEGPSFDPKRAPVIVHVTLVATQPEKDDPHNYVYALTFPRYAGATETERLLSALDAAFGAQPDVPTTTPEADPELLALKDRVQGMLPQLRERFSRGVPPGEHLSVKVPFEIDGGGGSERMWVVVDSWDATKIRGTLNNDPTAIKRLRAGAHLDVDPGDVTDYAWYKKDGSFEGGESIDILSKRQKP